MSSATAFWMDDVAYSTATSLIGPYSHRERRVEGARQRRLATRLRRVDRRAQRHGRPTVLGRRPWWEQGWVARG